MATDDDIVELRARLSEVWEDGIDRLRAQIRDLPALAAAQGEQLDALSTTVDALQRTVEQLITSLPQAQAGTPAPVAWCWPDLSAEAAAVAWRIVSTWTRAFLVARFPLADAAVYPCWYRHPEAVDALSALYATWHAAYRDPAANAERAAFWLDRWLPAGIAQITAALRCIPPRSTLRGLSARTRTPAGSVTASRPRSARTSPNGRRTPNAHRVRNRPPISPYVTRTPGRTMSVLAELTRRPRTDGARVSRFPAAPTSRGPAR